MVVIRFVYVRIRRAVNLLQIFSHCERFQRICGILRDHVLCAIQQQQTKNRQSKKKKKISEYVDSKTRHV